MANPKSAPLSEDSVLFGSVEDIDAKKRVLPRSAGAGILRAIDDRDEAVRNGILTLLRMPGVCETGLSRRPGSCTTIRVVQHETRLYGST
jgi:hypothetical protein